MSLARVKIWEAVGSIERKYFDKIATTRIVSSSVYGATIIAIYTPVQVARTVRTASTV